MTCVDVLPAIRSSRFDLPLTYDAGLHELKVGDVVRVPLGSRDVLAYVVRAPYEASVDALRPVHERLDVERAFDDTGLALARFVADAYVCTLGEALSAAVRAEALPRIVDLLVRESALPDPRRFPSVPRRLLALIWEDFDAEFPLDRLLRHPEARRIADRAALLRHVRALVRAGVLRRERKMLAARAHAYRIRTLYPGVAPARGKKSAALYGLVLERGSLAYADAVLAGFSNALIGRALRSGVLVERDEVPQRVRPASASVLPEPTREQTAAIDRIGTAVRSASFEQILLHGVTGSGKTLVYLRAIEEVVAAGGRAIVLVPEIALTPQTAARFEAVFGGRVAVLHSALSERERLDAWQACARGEVDVVVGARSAVFAPLENVRLLVVDEAHESSYKQDVVPRYHAVAVARERMRIANGVLVLGSATPSLESYAAALAGRLRLVELAERVTGSLPDVEIVDLTREFGAGRHAILSTPLVQALAQRLRLGEKSVLFVNRRGSARFLLCRSCGNVPECPRCSVSLAVHRGESLLRCHYCDHREALPPRCPRCGSESIGEFGPGTERLVEEIRRLFPRARVLRMDSDSTTRIGDHARILREFDESGDVLVGTQMVAKGLDFPQVTLAAVVAADVGLHVPDFRAAERTFALIMQVCGRSGRASPGTAIVQTYVPKHPAVEFAARHDYAGFAQRELEERRITGYPPFSRLVYLGVIGRSRARVMAVAGEYARVLERLRVAEVLGPAPFPIARLNEEWRFRIALRTHKPATVRRALRERLLPIAARDRTTRLAVNVDP